MGDAKEGNGSYKMPHVSLQSKHHEELLHVIDELRSQGISRYIDLPQIIVCGDQSSGKSSVLEAISGLKFPTKDNLCTRFATELILRRATTENAAFTIVPDPNRPENEKSDLTSFQPPSTALSDFAEITEAAEKCMGIDSSKRSFSKDVLRVELCGPKQPHLTLVDLPGLFHSDNKLQSGTDAEAVKSLVQSYMEKNRSIILAVVSASNDYNQIVTNKLDQGSDSERSFVNLAENKDVHFRLGWHVLKNRDYKQRDSSSEQRDSSEEDFFAKGIWTSLPPSHVGVKSLKPRLSRVLKDQILVELPSLIHDVEEGVSDCRQRLSVLGESHGTLLDQRRYLMRISQRFTTLISSAVGGIYADPFFGDPATQEGYSRRLRAVVQNSLNDFAELMRKSGSSRVIVKFSEDADEDVKPKRITRDQFINEVKVLMKRTRGRELMSTYNPMIVSEPFYDHAKPWQSIADDFTERILDVTLDTLHLTISHVADSTTSAGVLAHVVNPAIETIKEQLLGKVKQTLAQHQRGHPITYNDYLPQTMQNIRSEEWQKHNNRKLHSFFGVDPESTGSTFKYYRNDSFDVKALSASLQESPEADMEHFACNEAITCMEAYYKVAKKFFIDDYSIHCIEECLIAKLADIMTPETIMSFNDEVIEGIAAETDESKVERTSSAEKLKVLSNTLKILHRLERHNPQGKEDNTRAT